MKAKALKLEIYKHKSGDCSNGGISSRFNDVYVLHPYGCYEIDMDNPPENLCQLVIRNLFGKEYRHIEPVAAPTGCGWMDGGCIVYDCDSRFNYYSDYPLKLHDRQETQREYDILSRD